MRRYLVLLLLLVCAVSGRSQQQPFPGQAGGINGDQQCNVNGTLSACINGSPAIQYVSAAGNDANDGFSFTGAKLTVYAALQALPGGSVTNAGVGTIYISSTVNYGGPAANQGMWIMGSGDPNFATPPSGWLKWNPSAGQSLTIDCLGKDSGAAHGHETACVINGGGSTDLVHPALWISSTQQLMSFRNLNLGGFLNTYVKIGIDSNNNRTTGGVSSVSLTNVGWNHGSCRAGGGPGLDIGSNSFWIWLKGIVGSGCVQGIFTVASSTGASRTSNVTTITTSATNNISNGDTVTIQNVPDDTFNGTYTVASIVDGTHFTYNNFGPNNSVGTGQVITASAAAINLDPGSGSGSGLVFIDDINLNNGGIRIVPGTNGGSIYIRNVSYEGDFFDPDMPPILVTKIINPTIVRVDNVEVSDPSVTIPDVQVDNPNFAALDAVIVTRVDGTVRGFMHTLGSAVPAGGKTALRAGQYGFNNGIVTAGGIDVHRRSFAPSIAPGANLAATTPGSWGFGPGAGTVISVAAPDGTNNAGRVTSNSGQSFINFYTQNNVAVAVGDFYIFGVWARSQTANGYSNQAPPVKFAINNNGFGAGDTCIPTINAGGVLFFGGVTTADGQWQWFSGLCKINSAPNTAGLVLTGIVDTSHTVDFYAPTLINFTNGTKSDNEAWEIANNLSSFSAGVPAGTVSMLRGQSFAMSVGSNFLLSHTGTITADRTITWPDTSGTIVFPSLAQTWTADQSFANTNGIRFFSPNGTNWVKLTGPATNPGSNVTWQLPSADSSGVQCVSSNGSGVMAFVNCSGGTGTPGGSNKNFQYNSSSTFGGTSNGNYTAATGVFDFSQLANSNNTITGHRFTDSSPTGNWLTLQNAALNSTLFNVDVAGNMTANSAVLITPLSFANGGTNQTTFTANQLVTDTAGALASLAGTLTGTNPILTLTAGLASAVPLTLNTAPTPTGDIFDLQVNGTKTSFFDNGAFLHVPQVTFNGSNALVISGTESTCPTPQVGIDFLCVGNSATHTIQSSLNGTTFKDNTQWNNSGPTAHGVAIVGVAFPQLTSTSAGTSGQPLCSNGASSDPAFCNLGVAGGGTGNVTNTAHGVMLGEGTSAVAFAGPDATANQPLLSVNATSDPVFGALPLGNASSVSGILPIVNGGIGANSFASAGILTPTGSITVGHCASWSASTVLQDSGGTCGGAGGAPPLHTITAATASNTINSTTNPQIWNWALTGSTTAFQRGENTAATGSSNILDSVHTLSGSTAVVSQWDNNGNGWQIASAGQLQRIGTASIAVPGTAHGVVVSEGNTSAVVTPATGTAGQVLISNGSSADPSFQDPIVSFAFVNIWTAQDVTTTRTSAAIRNPLFSQTGTLQLTWASITGSPATCTLQIQGVDSQGNALNDGSTFSVSPANGTTSQQFTAAAGLLTAAQIKAIFACVTYPTTGTLTLDFTPIPTVTVTGAVTTTPPSNASTNVAQFGGTNVSTGTGASGAGIPRVTISNDSSLAANQSVNESQINGVTPLMGNGTSGTGSQRVNVANDNSAVANWGHGATGSAVPANATAEGLKDTSGNLQDALADTNGRQIIKTYPDTTTTSYHASATVSSAASATDIAVLPGNATNTVLVSRVIVTCTQTTAGIITLQLIKRSTADTAGTSANMTVVPDDSNYAAGVSVPKTYTANPTTGTAVGNIDTALVGCMAAGNTSANDMYMFVPLKPIVLRGTAQQLTVNLNAATVTGGSFAVTYEYSETTTP